MCDFAHVGSLLFKCRLLFVVFRGSLHGAFKFFGRIEIAERCPFRRQRHGLVHLLPHKLLHAPIAAFHRRVQAACNVDRPVGEQRQKLPAVLQQGDALCELRMFGGSVQQCNQLFR